MKIFKGKINDTLVDIKSVGENVHITLEREADNGELVHLNGRLTRNKAAKLHEALGEFLAESKNA